MESDEEKPLLEETGAEVKVDTLNEPQKRWLTVEPIILLYYIYYSPCLLVADQYIFNSLSEKYNLNSSNNSVCGCNNQSGQGNVEEQVQSESSRVMLVLNSVGTVTAMASSLFFGAYSDDGGRKVVNTLPMVGSMLKSDCFLLVISLKLSYWYLVIGMFIEGFFGSILTCLMGCYAYIADISSVERRTFRVTLLEVFVGASTAVSQLISGYLIKSIGYFYIFLILFICTLLNLTYTLYVLRESRPRMPGANY